MYLDSATISELGALLVKPPLDGTRELVERVWLILGQGNDKHGTDAQTATQHVEAALRHLGRPGIDEETGQPHTAHATARLLLALLQITRRES